MAIISGILQDGLGNPINGSLTLRARRTTANVIEDTEVKFTTENGEYFLNLLPCEYDVFLAADGYSKKPLGIITVYQDSPDGTLNEYVITPSGSELTPEILKQVLEARDEAKKSAEEARESSSGTSVLTKLSSSDGSARIGHYGSNVQSVMDSNGQLHYWIAQMAAGKRVNIICYGDSTTD
ncbi:prophage tail fiber N-terminal domain-containing protein, partial [Gilliamella apicola]|uniref:prophage tail fiber N-terminal domain-containing protein n=1 Tax=Gilliamella apicola TaxID=1196095 RepID=UPI000B637FF0